MVDDQPGKLLSYEVILASLGENLIKAHSGREALDHLLRTNIAVVLMDVSMPELDGFELADMIRQHPRFRNTAIAWPTSRCRSVRQHLKHASIFYTAQWPRAISRHLRGSARTTPNYRIRRTSSIT